ncbi:MAG: MoxR family ATPase [Bacteroidota bacterium]
MSFYLYNNAKPTPLPDFQPSDTLNNPALYHPSEALQYAVNVALSLGQPLLLTGEPGTGKTQLAFHIAHYFGLEKPLLFTAQTTSTARDLFYTYDALGHFQYNQNNKQALTTQEVEKRFIRYNALGEAIQRKSRLVVLIDEIDKAPRDFPNDLLYMLEELRFEVPEVSKVYEGEPTKRPIIIITSNSEKSLPDAFMRRVVFHHIEFPEESQLLQILSEKTEQISREELELIVSHFFKIRRKELSKKPSTAELIYWALLLQRINFPINKLGESMTASQRSLLMSTYGVLTKNKDDLSLLEQLI